MHRKEKIPKARLRHSNSPQNHRCSTKPRQHRLLHLDSDGDLPLRKAWSVVSYAVNCHIQYNYALNFKPRIWIRRSVRLRDKDWYLKVARCRILQEAGNETRTTQLLLALWWLTQLKPLRFQHTKHVLSFDAISHSNQINRPNTALLSKAQEEEKE